MLRSLRRRTSERIRSSATGEGLDSPRLIRLQQAAHALQERDVAPEVSQARAQRREAKLAALEPEFYEPDFNAVLNELQRLPARFDEAELEPVVEARAVVLEIVSEKLSQHVLKNYSAFVSGVNEVASIEQDLQEAYRLAKVSRGELAVALAEVDVNMKIAAQTKQKQGLMAILDLLLSLQQMSKLHDALKESLDNGEYAGAFWLCAQTCRALEPLHQLRAAQQLEMTVNRLYADCLGQLEAALATACSDFTPALYEKVLEGYIYLGGTARLGEEVMHAYASAVDTAVLKTLRSILLTRSGLEGRVKGAGILQELIKLLPADLFRVCLARVLAVIFGILVSHRAMAQWHQERIAQHVQDAAELAERREQVAQRLASHEQASSSHKGTNSSQPSKLGQQSSGLGQQATSKTKPSAPEHSHSSSSSAGPAANGASRAEGQGSSKAAAPGPSSSSTDGPAASRPGRAEGQGGGQPSGGPGPSAPSGAAKKAHVVPADVGSRPRHKSSKSDGDLAFHALENGHALSRTRSHDHLPGPPAEPAGEAPLTEQLEGLEERQAEEEMWGQALFHVSEGLSAGRRWLWDEASRKISVLLASPAAFAGEHFLQVMEWTQQMLVIGESFSSAESATLRDALARQSGKFFEAFHAGNMQAMRSMLERELWKRLPLVPGSLPDLSQAMEASGADAPTSGSFEHWAERGNPWSASSGTAKQAGAKAHENGDAASAGGRSDEESEDLYGDNIDEENQRVERAASQATASTSGNIGDMPPMTNASWKLVNWLSEYAHLMRALRTESGRVFGGLCQLFELYLLHIFHTFSDVSLAELSNPNRQQQGGADAVPVRLRNSLARILSRSLMTMRPFYLPLQPGTSQLGQPPGSTQQGVGVSAARTGSGTEPTALINAGNMYGLQERLVAADSLMAVAAQLQSAQTVLGDRLVNRTDVSAHHTPDIFFQTVKAAGDVRDVILRAAARLNVPIRWLPDRIADSNFNLEEPPSKASPWVPVLLGHLQTYVERLSTMPALSPADVHQLWTWSLQYAAEMLLEGMSKAGVRSKCTVMGRSAMSLDLQGVTKGLGNIFALTGNKAPANVADHMRLVDTYIKAFYLPWGEEIRHWAQTHPEYTRDQIIALVTCIAEANQLKRKDRAAMIAQLEADFEDLRR